MDVWPSARRRGHFKSSASFAFARFCIIEGCINIERRGPPSKKKHNTCWERVCDWSRRQITAQSAREHAKAHSSTANQVPQDDVVAQRRARSNRYFDKKRQDTQPARRQQQEEVGCYAVGAAAGHGESDIYIHMYIYTHMYGGAGVVALVGLMTGLKPRTDMVVQADVHVIRR